MFRTELLLILPLVVAVTVGQANRGYSYYGTSNVRDQRPQPINGQRPLLLPGRPMTVTGPVTVAPVAPAPVLGPSAPAATPSTTAPSYAPLPRPRPLYTPVYRPLLPPRPIRPAPPGVTPPQSSAIGEPLPPVTESAPPLQPVKPNTLEAPILPEPAVEQPEPAPIPILPSQTGEPVVVEPVPEPVPIGEPAPFAEQSTAPELIQPSAVVSQPIPQPEPIRQPEPESQPEPIWQPEPEPQPEPIRQPEPEPQPEPIRQPEPEPQPEPIRQPESEPQPEPIREPQLGPIRQPEPEPQPEPIRQPDPEPQPEPIRQPKLEPQTEPIRQPEPVLIPEPIPQPEPIPEPELVQQSELALQPEYYPPPEPTQEIVQAQEPAVIPEREAVPFLEPLPKPVPSLKLTSTAGSINVPQSPTPVALLPLLPKHHPVRELVFSRHPQSSVSPMIYYPTITYPTQTPAYPYFPTPPRPVPTQAPPVVVTTLSHPAVTQTSGQLKFDFHCKEGNGYYSVEHECDTYIECKQNRVMKYACPDGLHFNPAAKHYEYPCAYPSEVKCITGDQEQNPKPTDKCPNQYGFYSMNDGDCSTFIMCQEGLATIMNCSMGLAFNPQTSSCDWPANVPQCNPNIFKDFVCPDPPEDEDGQVSEIIYKYRYEGQCKLYIACQLGHPRLLSCGRGLSFDDASQACIDEEYVTDCTVPNIYRY